MYYINTVVSIKVVHKLIGHTDLLNIVTLRPPFIEILAFVEALEFRKSRYCTSKEDQMC